MKLSPRRFGSNETLGIVSIVETAINGAYALDQDLKGRWHVWAAPAAEPDHSDHVARQLEGDLFSPEV
jgi:hypothetical protein